LQQKLNTNTVLKILSGFNMISDDIWGHREK